VLNVEYHLVNLESFDLFPGSSMIPSLMFLPNSVKNLLYLSLAAYSFYS